MPKYIYKGAEVQLVPGQQFNTHWNVFYNHPTENGGSIPRIASVQIGELQIIDDDAVPEKIQIPDSFNPATMTESIQVKVAAININTADFNSLRSALPGIGRNEVKAILKNKPSAGYADFSHLVDLNPTVKVQWEPIEALVKFEG